MDTENTPRTDVTLAARFERFLRTQARDLWSGCLALRTQGHSWLISVPPTTAPCVPTVAVEADDIVLQGVVSGHIAARDAMRWGDVRLVGEPAACAALMTALMTAG